MAARRRLTSCLLLAGACAQQPLTQERVVVVSRHGIRVPFPPLATLPADVYSTDDARDWFSDPVAWGADQIAALTTHGKQVIYEMGTHFRQTLLNSSSLAGFFIYSAVDSTKRDILTAVNFFRGAFPEANVTEKDMFGPNSPDEEAFVKILMNQGDFNSRPGCPSSATIPEVIAGEVGGDLASLSVEQGEHIMELNEQLACCKPVLCTSQGNASYGDRCTLMSLPTKWEGQQLYWEDFTGPITVAGKLMELIQLLYLNGMPWNRLVPAMTEPQLASLMRLHEESVGIASEYWNARNAGSELLLHIAASLQQRAYRQDIEGVLSTVDDSLVYYAAHDINIYFLRELLRLNWLTTSYNPNQSPPGGMLIFVLYSSESVDSKKAYFVKTFFMSQSMRQQREATKLSVADPASRVFAVIPGCATGPELSCPFEDFRRLVLNEIISDCVQLVDPQVLLDEREGDPSDWWKYCLAGGLSAIVGTLFGCLALPRLCGGHNRARQVAARDRDLGTSLATA